MVNKTESPATGGDAPKDTPKTTQENKLEKAPKKPPTAPLDAAARRLERLLATTSASDTEAPVGDTNSNTSVSSHLNNPVKIVRKWLGTSCGSAANASLEDLSSAAGRLLDPTRKSREILVDIAPASMEESPAATAGGEEKKDDSPPAAPQFLNKSCREVEAWLLSIASRLLWNDGQFAKSASVAQNAITLIENDSSGASRETVTNNISPTLFPLLARLHRYRSLAAEGLEQSHLLWDDCVRSHRMACLRRDVDTSSTLLNIMLRYLLNANQVEQAQKLLSNSSFPENASNNQLCRYLYHSGRVQALRLEYTLAFSNLSQCLRKSPTNTGLGFRIAARRLLVVVQLLMGEIPERSVFFEKGMVAELSPYLIITQAVRRGDLSVFHATVAENAARFRNDGTFTLISRLAHSVVKAGLRRLNQAYSRISLKDVATRLSLPSETSAEFVVAKAIRDGVIDATINHEGQFVRSHDLVDVYATTEPMEAFHLRIAYCLTTHNDAVRGMKYPPDAYKKRLEASRGKTGGADDDKTDEERAKELEDELEEEF
eukprot:CAMPEP_0194358214 /NCGR_PEP_ID=MMETSP0174-20130528/5499_1 /TAXON_ID=216777 /ORGANISM="Proboscia alata, Strain PI-D3" /LENGTH=544 /DNA_ID=CAMNT_0039128469 /DNA_START=58 /DNA_END=1692 /DNA_ORIENTATION=+